VSLLLCRKHQQKGTQMNMRHAESTSPASKPPAREACRESLTVRKSLLHSLVQLLGCDAVERLVTEFGGTRIWVPVRSAPEAKLTRVLGDSAACALCARYGGDYLQIPNTLNGGNIHRRIAELHRQGCKINDIALAVGRSRRTVFRLLRKKITDLRRNEGLTSDW